MDPSDTLPRHTGTATQREDNVLRFPVPARRVPVESGAPRGHSATDAPEVLSRHHPMRAVPVLDQLEQNWWALTTPESIPRRIDVTAATLGSALSTGFIATRVAPGHARLRVAGRRLSELVGSEARGMPLSCILTPDARPILAERMEMAFAHPAIIDLPLFARRSIARPALSGRLILLPLAERSGGLGPVRCLLGALLIDGALGARPRRLEIDPHASWRCDTISRPLRQPERFGPVARPGLSGAARSGLHLVVNNPG